MRLSIGTYEAAARCVAPLNEVEVSLTRCDSSYGEDSEAEGVPLCGTLPLGNPVDFPVVRVLTLPAA
ncbi:MAG: hypothetical protein EOO65_01165 [Methanosarcinales archaeon]|nr:MAG: hypothetical protein EOO65_01165 [Methanosarcinales archaeon]